MLKHKKILISGATGFIGANLVRAFLKEKADITILTRKSSNPWRLRGILGQVRELKVDLLDEKKLCQAVKIAKPEIILHTAVYGGYHFQQEQKKVLNTNIIGTINLLNACKKIGFALFVNTGSSSEYGLKSEPISEDCLLEPITDYGISKAAATLYCQAVSRRDKLPVVTLRLFSPYGYYEEPSRLIPTLIRSSLRGKIAKISTPDPLRDFIFIDDVISAYAKVIQYRDKVRGEIFNIGYGKQCDLADLAETVLEITGNRMKIKWGAMLNTRYEPQFWQADISKAKRILHWKPETDLEDGLKKTIAWFKNNLNLYAEVRKPGK